MRNIHGITQQCRALVENEMERLESYDEVRTKMRAEKDEQPLRAERILEAFGGAAASVGASITNDEIIKVSLAAYGLAHVEAAPTKPCWRWPKAR